MSDKTVDILDLIFRMRGEAMLFGKAAPNSRDEHESGEALDKYEVEINSAITALAAERDRAVNRANSYQMAFEEMREFRDEAAEERDALQARVVDKCACTFANVSDGPHPELPAKERMYAINVCWYHRFVHEERDALAAERDQAV